MSTNHMEGGYMHGYIGQPLMWNNIIMHVSICYLFPMSFDPE